MLCFVAAAAVVGVSDEAAVGADSARGLTVISSDIRVRRGCGDSLLSKINSADLLTVSAESM